MFNPQRGRKDWKPATTGLTIIMVTTRNKVYTTHHLGNKFSTADNKPNKMWKS
jgi:hypothetical protein